MTKATEAPYILMNCVHVTGLVARKWFIADPGGEERKDTLALVIRTSLPGLRMCVGENPDGCYDESMVLISGERAKFLDAKMRKGTRVSATGYTTQRNNCSHTSFMPCSLVIIADQVSLSFLGGNVNEAVFCGVVASVCNASVEKRSSRDSGQE